MKGNTKTIFTGFSPNLTSRDVVQALRFLLFPWLWGAWQKGNAQAQVKNDLLRFFDSAFAETFDSGRSALYYALKSLGVSHGDEVLVQAYTCVVVTNAIRWTGATPVYVDIDATLNMDPEDARSKVTPATKAMIIQHTFGEPAKLDTLLDIAKGYSIKTIEDCAHAFGIQYHGVLLGTQADIGMFSFGSDKSLSCVRGGALITNNSAIADKWTEYTERLPQTPRLLVFQHLMHLPMFSIGKNLYHIKIGKGILWLSKKLHVINKIIYDSEKKGKQFSFYPSLLSNALAQLLINQLGDIASVNQHRRKLAKIYKEALDGIDMQELSPSAVPLRFTLFVDDPSLLRAKAKKEGILLGDWYSTVIAPADIDTASTGYEKGDCPRAEQYTRRSINLPTNRHISEEQARHIAHFVKLYAR